MTGHRIGFSWGSVESIKVASKVQEPFVREGISRIRDFIAERRDQRKR